MRKVDISRKRPSAWPFVAGVVVLAFIGWGVTQLLRAEPEPPPPEVQPTEADSMRPSAIPAPPNDPDAAARLTALTPLDRRDLGRRVRASGTVVATGTGGYWLQVDEWVIRVESPRSVRTGDTLAVSGRLRESPPDPTPPIADEVMAGNPDAAGWEIVDRIALIEGGVGREP
jgi:hypothetical protein